MSVGLVGRKCGMTRIFPENGDSFRSPSSKRSRIASRPLKTAERDGYRAVQVTVGGAPKAHRTTKAEVGHFTQTKIDPAAGFGVPARRRRGCRAGPRCRAQGRSVQGGSVRQRQRHDEGQGLRGRHQAPSLLASIHVARQLAVAPCAGLHRPTANARPRLPGQAHGRPLGCRQGHENQPRGRQGRCRAQPLLVKGAVPRQRERPSRRAAGRQSDPAAARNKPAREIGR